MVEGYKCHVEGTRPGQIFKGRLVVNPFEIEVFIREGGRQKCFVCRFDSASHRVREIVSKSTRPYRL